MSTLPRLTLSVPENYTITQLAVSAGGNCVAAAARYGKQGGNFLWVWDASSDTETVVVKATELGLAPIGLKFRFDAEMILAYSTKGSAVLVDASSGKRGKNLIYSDLEANVGDLAAGGKRVVIGARSAKLETFTLSYEGDFNSPMAKDDWVTDSKRLGGDAEGIESLAISPDGRLLAVDAIGGVSLWDLEKHERLGLLTAKGWDGVAVQLQWNAASKRLAAIDETGTVHVFDVAARKILWSKKLDGDAKSGILAFAGDTLLHARFPALKAIEVHDVKGGAAVTTLTLPPKKKLKAVVGSADGSTFAASIDATTVLVW